MYQYRIFRQVGKTIRSVLIITGLMLLFLVSVQVLKIFLILRRANDLVTYGVGGILLITLCVLLSRLSHYREDHNTLNAKGFNLRADSSHASLKRYLRHLITYSKRLGKSHILPEAHARHARQRGGDLEDSLGHHPLNEDLIRGIAQARDDIIAPTYGVLETIGEKITQSKVQAVIQDIYQPPFPIVPPLVVIYHQFTLVSEITDLYLPNPSLGEYYRVQRDVWQIMTKGDFLRYGQRLFSGINTNTHRLGRCTEDLGEVFSIVWLNYAFAQAARIRCCTLHDWKLRDAISDFQRHMIPCLKETQDTLLGGAMPVIKKRIRTYAPLGQDPEQFVSNTIAAFTKAVENVLMTLNVTARESESANSTSPGLVASQHMELDETSADQKHAANPDFPQPVRVKKRRRRRRSSRPKGGFLKQLMHIIKSPK